MITHPWLDTVSQKSHNSGNVIDIRMKLGPKCSEFNRQENKAFAEKLLENTETDFSYLLSCAKQVKRSLLYLSWLYRKSCLLTVLLQKRAYLVVMVGRGVGVLCRGHSTTVLHTAKSAIHSDSHSSHTRSSQSYSSHIHSNNSHNPVPRPSLAE